MAPEGKKRGRPRKKFVITGRQFARLNAIRASTNEPAPSSSSNPSSTTPVDPESGPSQEEYDWQVRLATATYNARKYLTPIEDDDDDDDDDDSIDSAAFLSARQQRVGDGTQWQLKATVPTEELCRWFESERNDYHSYGKVAYGTSIKITWFTHPGDSPLDVRARPFVIRWQDDILYPEAKQNAIKNEKVVFRSKFTCAGTHNKRPKRKNNDAGDEGEGEDEDDGDEEAPKKVPRAHRCTGNKTSVKLAVEVTADDLSHAKIFQLYTHQETDPSLGALQFSRRIRCLIQERLHQYGADASKGMLELLSDYCRPEFADTPEWRRPTPEQIKSMLPAARRRDRLDRLDRGMTGVSEG